MELSLKDCPACGAVVMGDEQICSGCGKPLPVDEKAESQAPRVKAPLEEFACPRCGIKVPRGVLRCRDCGTFMSREVEAAALAQQAGRAYIPGGSSGGLVGGGAGFGSMGYTQLPSSSPATSSFAEVADDADFDLVPEVDLVDVNMRDIDEERLQTHDRQTSGSGSEDDFELGDGTGAVEYGIAGDSDEASYSPAAIAAPEAAPAASEEIESADAEAPSAPDVVARAGGNAPPVPEVAHSVETAGDVLLDAALAEQKEAEKRSRLGRRRHRRTAVTAPSGDRFLVYCPLGHRVQVHERHRGRTGRCPNCKSLFFVPNAETIQTLGQAGGESVAAASGATSQPVSESAAAAGAYTKWIPDVHLHRVNPAKLKLKPGSLEGDYQTVDLGACPEHLLIAVVYAGGGMFRAAQEAKKKPETRKAMLDHLAANKPLAELPVTTSFPLTPELLTQFRIVQPSVPGDESQFADVPVFGRGRIAIRVPTADAGVDRAYLSFTLSQFRMLSQTLSDVFGLAEYGSGTSIPLSDNLIEATCHYSEAVMQALDPQLMEFYKADPAIKLEVLGRCCQTCGLVVSETSRRKEKIGGKTDSSVARAKCPKCKSKFGDVTLYGVAPKA